jgi:hypothetical protein
MASVVGFQQHAAVLSGQPAQRVRNLPGSDGPVELVDGRQLSQGVGCHLDRSGPSGAAMVGGQVGHHGEQPWPQRPAVPR